MMHHSEGRRIVHGLLALVLGALPACAGLGKPLEPPTIKLADIRVQEVRALETIFQIHLRVLNVNDTAIFVKGIDCDLELNGRKIASGISAVNREIPSYGTTIIPVTVFSSVVDLFKGLLGIQGGEPLRYKIRGRLRLEGGFLTPPVLPFSSSGEVTLKDDPFSQ